MFYFKLRAIGEGGREDVDEDLSVRRRPIPNPPVRVHLAGNEGDDLQALNEPTDCPKRQR